MCTDLASLSLQELNKKTIYLPSVQLSLVKENDHPVAINKCIQCYGGQDNIAPRIPFKNALDFGKFGITRSATRESEDFVGTLVYYTNSSTALAHNVGFRMPLSRPPLPEAEQNEIIKWFEQGVDILYPLSKKNKQ